MQCPPGVFRTVLRSSAISQVNLRSCSWCVVSHSRSWLAKSTASNLWNVPSVWVPMSKFDVRPNQSWGRCFATPKLMVPWQVFNSAIVDDGTMRPPRTTEVRSDLFARTAATAASDSVENSCLHLLLILSSLSEEKTLTLLWSKACGSSFIFSLQQASASNRTTHFKSPRV